ncbi:MAG: endonuclease [Pseudomonadota bacterium]
MASVSPGATQPQTAFDVYDRELRSIFWNEVYQDGGETLYCGVEFKYRERALNIEHVFPVAWMTRHFDCGNHQQCLRASPAFNRMKADMHNMYPSREDVNYDRGSLPFGVISEERWDVDGCDFEVTNVVEPRPEVRGDIARAVLHMAESYEVDLPADQRRLMEDWHQADPPSRNEHRRNERIAELQGTRNRFIDGTD